MPRLSLIHQPVFVELMLDLYHAQIGEGNLTELCREALLYIGEIQIADVRAL